VQENEGTEVGIRRKRRSREEIAELVREFRSSGLTQRKFSENRGIALSESEDRASGERGSGYRIKIGAGFCSTTLRRLLEVLR
jgi:hypothetical protein